MWPCAARLVSRNVGVFNGCAAMDTRSRNAAQWQAIVAVQREDVTRVGNFHVLMKVMSPAGWLRPAL
jgi:hypothetical protein